MGKRFASIFMGATVVATVLGACDASTTDPQASGGQSATPTGATIPQIPWGDDIGDAAPGYAVVDGISRQLEVPFEAITAAVLFGSHPAGNSVYAWVFRVDGLTSREVGDRWVQSERPAGCPVAPSALELAGHHAVRLEEWDDGDCHPQYVVLLDATTVAVVTDSAGSHGELPVLAYRPVVEIESFVIWLEEKLLGVELQPGGNNPVDG